MDLKPDSLAPAQQFESAHFARKLFPLVEKLAAEFAEEWQLQVKDVGLLLKQLTIFLETTFGKNSTERRFPKIPAPLFRDASLNGSLHFVLKIYHSYLKTHSLPCLDFDLPHSNPHVFLALKRPVKPFRQVFQFLEDLKDALMTSGWWKVPVVHVDASNGNNTKELEAIVRSLGGTVCMSPDDPSVTHIVYPFGPEGDPDDGVQYLRSLESRPGEYFVHYWYFPDSYDSWMPADVAPENLEPDHQSIGPWKIYLRWLLDSQKFNEWMNPIDYETEEFQDEQETLQEQAEDTKSRSSICPSVRFSKACTGIDGDEDDDESNGVHSDDEVDSLLSHDKAQLKRKRDALNEFHLRTTPTQDESNTIGRRLRSEARRPEVNESAAIKIAPNVIQHSVVDVSDEAFCGKIEDISHCIDPPIERPNEEDDNDHPDFYRQLYTVPAHAAWFDWERIHSIEIDSVPVQADGVMEGLDPEFYKRSRNDMIDKFRARPHRRLSFSDVRKKLIGDPEHLKKIFDFLQDWGLINYFPISSVAFKRPKGSRGEGLSVSIPTSAPPLIHFSNSVTLPELNAAMTHGNDLAFSLLNKTNKYGKTVTDADGQPGSVRCSAMPWIECTDSYYHCVTRPDVDLCPQAFREGRFPAGTTEKDYIKMNNTPSDKTDGSGWTDQETLLLLEAIELYKDNWAEIAEHVATKSQLQCAMHWLTMSIDDDLIDDLLVKHPSSFQGTDEDFLKTLPFADARNPVMAQIAFLATMVSPEVAGAAAHEALDHLSKEDDTMEDSISFHTEGMNAETLRKAAVAGLRSATIKAKRLAEQQETEIRKLMNVVMDTQIKKIELKLSHYAELDKALDEEKSQTESIRQRLNADRLKLKAHLHPLTPEGELQRDRVSIGNGIEDGSFQNGH